jgi:hypothetical protein
MDDDLKEIKMGVQNYRLVKKFFVFSVRLPSNYNKKRYMSNHAIEQHVETHDVLVPSPPKYSMQNPILRRQFPPKGLADVPS